MSEGSRFYQRNYRVGQWTVLPGQLQIKGPQGQVELPAKVFEVLRLLMEAPGETLSRERLIDEIWHGQKEVGEKALNHAIWQVRKGFSDTGGKQEVIRTIAKTGYVLQLPVQELPQQALKRRRWAPLVAALALVVALVLWLWPSTPLPLAPLAKRPQPLTHLQGVEETPAFTRDGSQMAFQWDKGKGIPGIYIQPLDNPQQAPRRVSLPDEYGASPTWSGDGKQLAYAVINQPGCKVKVLDLASGQGRFIDNCHANRLFRTLAWSKTGNMLAYAYRNSRGGVSLKGFDFTNNQTVQLSPERGDFEDMPIDWANHSQRLAYASLKSNLGNIYIRSADGSSRPLFRENREVFSLAWSPDDNYIYFSSVWQGEVTILQVSVSSGEVSPLSFESVPGRISVRPGPHPQLVYPRYSTSERLFRVTKDGSLKVLPFSHGRELYPFYSQSQNRLVFFSNRGGDFQIWSAALDDSSAKELTQMQGDAYIHALSNKGDRFLLPIKRKGEKYYSLFIGQVQGGALKEISKDNFASQNFSWGKDDQSLLFSSDLDGKWQIWRHDLATGIREQLTVEGAIFAQERGDGTLFFVKPGEEGVWQQMPKGKAIKVVTGLANTDWGNWQLTEQGIIYLQRTDLNDRLMLHPWNGDPEQQIAALAPRSVKGARSFTVLPDGSLVLSMYEQKEADILAIDLP